MKQTAFQIPVVSPHVSIIIPTYNYGHFIGSTITNIQEQTLEEWECIIVDDGSTDNTRQIIEEFKKSDNRIKYIHQENMYQAAAKNAGLKVCSGKYIQFLDADDLLESRKLERQFYFLEEHQYVDIVYGNTRYFPSEELDARWYFMNKNDPPWIPEISGSGEKVISTIVNNNFLTINSPLIRKSVFEDVGSFDEDLKLVEDWHFWIRCALKVKFVQYENWPLTTALVRSHSTSSSRNRAQVNASTALMRQKLDILITDEETKLLNKNLLNELVAWIHLIKRTEQELKNVIGDEQNFILIDQDEIRHELKIDTCSIIPFMENDGAFWGLPADDAEARDELERQIRSGAEFIAFWWNSFWWRDQYPGFYKHLCESYVCVINNDRLIAFDLANKLYPTPGNS